MCDGEVDKGGGGGTNLRKRQVLVNWAPGGTMQPMGWVMWLMKVVEGEMGRILEVGEVMRSWGELVRGGGYETDRSDDDEDGEEMEVVS